MGLKLLLMKWNDCLNDKNEDRLIYFLESLQCICFSHDTEQNVN